MATPFKGITIHEGYNEIGTFTINISTIQAPSKVVNYVPVLPTGSRKLLFRFENGFGRPVTQAYVGHFTVLGRDSNENVEYFVNPNADGYLEVDTPILPVVVISDAIEENALLRLNVVGPLNERAEECYIEVLDDLSASVYTLIYDFFIHDGKLAIQSGLGNYYDLAVDIEVSEDISAIHVTSKGEIFGYDITLEEWTNLGSLELTKIEFPQNLAIVEDGFYSTTGTTGTLTTGEAGGVGFEDYSIALLNPGIYLLDVELEVSVEPDGVVYTHTYVNLMPGNFNFTVVTVPGDAPEKPDESPTITEISTLTGITFSAEFLSFLTIRELNTIESIRKVGPIQYIKGFKSDDISDNDLNIIQGHVDFYSLNQNAEQNQRIISQGYETIVDIAFASRDAFINTIINEDISLFQAAKIHELAVQNQKLVGNLTVGLITDLKRKLPSTPTIYQSNFVERALSKILNSCGCDDCKSVISPFAYLLDLLKYGGANIDYNGSPTPYIHGSNLPIFISLISTKFLQPFGTLHIDCKTLHDEFCRVRLVTELLESLVSSSSIGPPKDIALETERNQFLQLVYQTILLQAGTSINEVRNVYLTSAVDKPTVAQKLATKLSIPLYVPSTTDYTTDVLWLTLNTADLTHKLTAPNLETIFGFRDTQRDVLTNPLESHIQDWHGTYLRDFWRTQDYVFTNYSREGVIPGTPASYKSNWMPIIDPDMMGWEDMTYLGSSAAKALWNNRKTQIDIFLKSCVDNDSMSLTLSADIKSRILRVVNRNIVSDVIEDDMIHIQNPVGGLWVSFVIDTRTLNQTNTDVSLSQSATAVFSPYDDKMRYSRIISVISFPVPSAGTPFTLTWPTSMFTDATGSLAKLKSTGDLAVYESGIDFNFTVLNDTQVEIEFISIVPNSNWLGGNISLSYEIEVDLYTITLVDPVSLLNDMSFTDGHFYYPLTPAVISPNPYPYTVLSPSWWPPGGTYDILKQLYALLSSGLADDLQLQIIKDEVHLTITEFNRLMVLLSISEKYLASIFTAPRPTIEEQYEMASILWTAGKTQLQSVWVEEEINYIETGITPIKLMLTGQYFWKALNEPVFGPWDPSLQTIPDTFSDIDPAIHTPIINPLYVNINSFCVNPEAKQYRDLYDTRKILLDGYYDNLLILVTPYDIHGFTNMLNYVNTGNPATSYDISPYTTYTDLIADLISQDVFKQKKAGDVVYTAFGISASDFLQVNTIKEAYENVNAINLPTPAVLAKAVKLLLSGYARMQLYFAATTGWIDEEITGDFAGGDSEMVYYYNVLNMKLASWRGNVDNRREWQNTLAAWNRQPFIQPDLLPPENIINFVSSNIVYTIWNTRKSALITEYTTIETTFNSLLDVGTLFDELKNHLDLIVARVNDFTRINPPSTYNYLPYFLQIKEIEDNGDDIRPNLIQLGITTDEYRYLANIYHLLDAENIIDPGVPSSLITSEYDDVINIIIAIRSRNLPFEQVEEEFTEDILMDQDYFLIYKPALVSFPLSDLPVYNKWRSPYKEMKAWKDILEGRIDMEQGVNDRWLEVLKEAEDRNMPLMRDALIRALTPDCVAWQDMGEQLAKTYFIETKDNCCVKHTRVSFAIETLQGFYMALQNGIYDGFISDFELKAPSFVKEWEWLGSYATWRAAIFVFLYPENLLYPTLKKIQSPAFIKLADNVQNANRFSPENACQAAKEYQEYIDDIKNLEICCSVNTAARIALNNPDDCCVTELVGLRDLIFYFGKGKSGISYWSKKELLDTSAEAHGFWEELPVRKEAKLLGCFVYSKRPNDNYLFSPTTASLYLFYSYSDGNKLKISYIKKDIYDANSSWSDETETDDIPEITSDDHISKVTACQTQLDIRVLSFIISYTVTGQSYFGQTSRDFDPETDKWIVPNTDLLVPPSLPIPNIHFEIRAWSFASTYQNPITVIRHTIDDGGIHATMHGYTHAYEKELIIVGYTSSTWTDKLIISFYKITGAFESNTELSTIIVFHEDINGNRLVQKIKIKTNGFAPNSFSNVRILGYDATSMTSIAFNNISKVYPIFALKTSNSVRQLAFGVNDNTLLTGAGIFIANTPGTLYALFNTFALVPEKTFNTPIQSAECIVDMDQRAIKIKNEISANLNAPQGTSVNTILRTTAVRELLYEAYYFVPMLLALDQQKRGEFPTALNWYRSVYDFTKSVLSARKIFYGLKLEESIVNVYTHTPQWLLDPLNPHLVAQSRACAYTKYTLINIVQCLFSYADREFTTDTIETVPLARRLYTEALELLNVLELQLKPNACEVMSEACLDGLVELRTLPEWANLYANLKTNLSKLGSKTLIENIETEIIDLLNSGTEDTYAEKFSDAFQLIKDTTPDPVVSDTLLEHLSGALKLENSAFSYLFAIDDHRDFNEAVANNFTNLVTTISGINKDDLESDEGESRISWLSSVVLANNEPYEFGFANESGIQNMSGSNRYNPVTPSRQAYDANITYTNASRVSYRRGRDPKEYIPLLDFTFCFPKNPVYQSLQLKGNVEIYKIQNCRNIAGMVRELEAYAAATDSTTGMPFIGASGNLVTPGIGNYPPSQYHFKTLIERAKQIVAQAQQMESLFLASLEKLDAENYSQLRARQDLQTAKATVKLQNLRITQANDEQGSAVIQLNKATFTQQHYNDLISAGNNAFEIASIILLQGAVAGKAIAAAAQLASSYVDVSGIGFSLGSLADALSTQSSVLSQLASFERRSEEWGFQKDLAGFDVSLANQQIKISEDNVRIVTQERDIAQMNTDHAQDSLEFLKTKFTNAELYNYMSNVLERSYSYMLNLATSTARVAENQLYFERQEQAGPFILDDYWESPSNGAAGGSTDRRGLTGSARLAVDITRLDDYAFTTNKRKLQMTKVISLAQNFPSEFQSFKETGVINFALTNKMFDYDFPGHYLRLINSVKTTVVGLLPVYDSIKATLTSAATSYTVIGGTVFQRTPIRRGTNDSVALTSANNATGVFEMQPMQNELLNPFENIGIESQWEFKMPRFANRMDYTNIADVLLTVEYTALDSFIYRTQVLQDLDYSLSFNRGFSFKNNFPDQWYELAQVEDEGPNATFDVIIELKREMFPQGIVDLKLNSATGVKLYFARADGYTNEIEVADFNLANATVAGPSGDTVNGVFPAANIVNSNPTPLMKLKLSFENKAVNRQLFSEGNVTDILLLVGCKAELNTYPL